MNIGFWKFCYFVLAGTGLAICLYYGDYPSAMLITVTGFMVAQS